MPKKIRRRGVVLTKTATGWEGRVNGKLMQFSKRNGTLWRSRRFRRLTACKSRTLAQAVDCARHYQQGKVGPYGYRA